MSSNVTSAEHTQLARELSANATVLLQNRNNVLPLDAASLKTIAVIGKQAGPGSIVHGGGSGHVDPSFVVYPLAGIKAALGFPDDHVYNTDAKDCVGDVVGCSAQNHALAPLSYTLFGSVCCMM